MSNQNTEKQVSQDDQQKKNIRPLEEIIKTPNNTEKVIIPQEAFARLHGYEDL